MRLDFRQIHTGTCVIFRESDLRHYASTDTPERARRIVACVNALEGVTTDDLESGAFKAEIARTLAQYGELLKAVTQVAYSDFSADTARDKLRFTLAKVRGMK